MRPRTEVAIGLGALIVLVGLGAALGQRENRPEQQDPRASSFLPGPRGARGLAEALTRLGVRVERYRRSARQLRVSREGAGRSVLVLLDPVVRLSPGEVGEILAWQDSSWGGDLLLAGPLTAGVMRCFGFQPDVRGFDSVSIRAPGQWPRVSAVLAATIDTQVVDSSRVGDIGRWTCSVPPIIRVDTLLSSTTGRVVTLRLVRGDRDRHVLLLADATLLRNRAVRETSAGPWALELLAGSYRRVIFDEAHQGYETGGSLAGATLDWSKRSPWGWAAWQLAFAGLVGLGFGAVRFGPIRSVIQRRRRSPLEHVRALATALAAARGHDVAIGAVVQGLRRRLLPAGQRGRTDWKVWVDRLAPNLRSQRAREAAATLQSLTRPGQPPESVLQAANAVEDVWQELRP
jgi:hypothetical protein